MYEPNFLKAVYKRNNGVLPSVVDVFFMFYGLTFSGELLVSNLFFLFLYFFCSSNFFAASLRVHASARVGRSETEVFLR